MQFECVYRSMCLLLAAVLLVFFHFPPTEAKQSFRSDLAKPPNPVRHSSPTQTDPIEEHLRAAETSQLANNLETAETEYRTVISLGLQKIAASRDSSRAESHLPAAYLATLKDVLANSYHNLGVIYAQKNQYPEASRLFGQAAKWSVHIKDLDRNWGTASFRANEYKTAIAPLRRHAQAHPEDTSARQMLAVCYFMTDDFSKAAELFRPLLESLPNDPSLFYAAGVSMAKSGDSRTAESLFQRMLAQNPDSAQVHLFLGQARAGKGEDAEALKEFARALELNPNLPEVHYSAGKIYSQQGNLEDAEKEFRAELEVNPNDAPAEYRLGHVLLLEDKGEDAVKVLSEAVRQRPRDVDALYELGRAFLKKGDPLSAAQRLEKAIRIKPEQSYMYYQLSLAYRAQGRLKEANAALQHYQELQQKKLREKQALDAKDPG